MASRSITSNEFGSVENQNWKIHKIDFNDFAKSCSERVWYLQSPMFECLGAQWSLWLLPGGRDNYSGNAVSLYLKCCSDEYKGSVGVRSNIVLSNGEIIGDAFHNIFDFGCGLPKLAGWPNYIDRQKLLGFAAQGKLLNDVLSIDLYMRKEDTNDDVAFVPPNPLCQNVLKLFLDENSADVLFEVGEQETRRATRKRAKTSPTRFYAHRFILQSCAPTLAELCGSGEGTTNPIPIEGIKPDIFHHLLHYLYGGKVPADVMNENAEAIINAADRFDVVNLKLEAESSYVATTTISTRNVVEILLYADAKNCALLKEAAMDFLVENGEDALDEVDLDDVPAHMFKELLSATTRGMNKARVENGCISEAAMRISTLREKLHEKGLDVDGSRETLMMRLSEYNDSELE